MFVLNLKLFFYVIYIFSYSVKRSLELVLYIWLMPNQNNFFLSYLILSYLILFYLILSYLIVSYLILSYLILSYLILYAMFAKKQILSWFFIVINYVSGWYFDDFTANQNGEDVTIVTIKIISLRISDCFFCFRHRCTYYTPV